MTTKVKPITECVRDSLTSVDEAMARHLGYLMSGSPAEMDHEIAIIKASLTAENGSDAS